MVLLLQLKPAECPRTGQASWAWLIKAFYVITDICCKITKNFLCIQEMHLFSTPNPCGHGMKPAGLSGSLCLAVKVYGRCSPLILLPDSI